MNWTTRRLFAILIPFAILVLALIALLINMDDTRVTEALKQHQQNTLLVAVRTISNELSIVASDVSFLSQQQHIQNALSTTADKQQKVLEDLTKDFENFARAKGSYSQVRIINNKGREVVRVDYSDGLAVATEWEKLQDKSGRYYVTEGLKLKRGEIYVSPFDLNVEHGKIETPYRPMIRFVAPIFSGGRKTPDGIVILNYSGKKLLEKLEQVEFRSKGKLLLVNRNGYYMHGHSKDEEWGFMFDEGKGRTLKNSNAALWQAANALSETTVLLNGEFYSHAHVCDLKSCASEHADGMFYGDGLPFKGADFPWTIISHVTSDKFIGSLGMKEHWFWLYGVIAVLSGITSLSGMTAWQLKSMVSQLSHAEGKVRGIEKLLTEFIDNNPSPAFAKDREGHYQIANSAYAALLGIEREELIGRTDFDVTDDAAVTERIGREQQVLHKQHALNCEEYWSGADKLSRHYAVTRFPIKGDDNTIVAVGCIAVDMTALDETKETLATREAMFETLVESAPDSIMMVEERGTISFANHVACDVFGYSHEEMMGLSIEELIPPDKKISHTSMLTGYTMQSEQRIVGHDDPIQAIKRDGSFFLAEIILSPLYINKRRVVMCVVRDVTDRTHLQQHIQQTQKMEAIGQLTGGVAHDFNNLLGIIIGNLDLLEPFASGNEVVEKRVAAALKAALSGSELTKRLLAFSRKQALRPEPTQLHGVIEEIEPLVERTLKGGVTLTTKIDSNLPQVLIDPSEFENIILNLCINARDAMPEGGMITIEAHAVDLDDDYIELNQEEVAAGTYVQVSISDTGSGMPQEVLKHVFEPFFTTKEKGKGTGLGLSMVHGFIKQSKGIIKIYSEVDVGTTIHLYLPALESEESILGRSVSRPAEPPVGTERILIVDDERDLAEVAEAYLQSLGYQTTTVNSGEDALNCLEQGAGFDLVLTDVVMPGGIDGFTLCSTAKEQWPELRFVYTSGFSEQALKARHGQDCGIEMVSKPFRKQQLAIAVRNALDS